MLAAKDKIAANINDLRKHSFQIIPFPDKHDIASNEKLSP